MHRDTAAVVREGGGDGATDAAGGAGDQDNLLGETHVSPRIFTSPQGDKE